jgi:hypothetical protein
MKDSQAENVSRRVQRDDGLYLAAALFFALRKQEILIEKLALKCGITKSELKELDSQAIFEMQSRIPSLTKELLEILNERGQK